MVEEWKRVSVETWSKEDLISVNFVNSTPVIINNEILSNPYFIVGSYEQIYYGLLNFNTNESKFLDLENVIVFDHLLNSSYKVEIAYTRHLEKLLNKNRAELRTITVAITNGLLSSNNRYYPGWTSHSKKVQKRMSPSTPIDDVTEAGIALRNITNYIDSDVFNLAHEIGHLLIRRKDDHHKEDENNNNWSPDNLMNEIPYDNNLEPIQWIHALGLDGDISYFVEEE